MHKSFLKVFFGFLVSPAIPAFLIYIAGCLFGKYRDAVWTAMLILTMSYLAAFLIGIPIYLLLQKYKQKSFKAYIISGLLVGLIFSLIIFIFDVNEAYIYGAEHAHARAINSIGYVLLGTMSGAISGIAFWFIAIKDSLQAD
jgi:hypothetical protein